MPDRARVLVDARTPEELAASAQAGEASAMEALWERFRPLVFRLLGSYAGQAIAEDLPGEAYAAFQQLTLWYDPSRGVPFAGYIQSKLSQSLRSAARRDWNLHAREEQQGEAVDDLGAPAGQAGPIGPEYEPASEAADDGIEERVIRTIMLWRLLDTLPHREKYVLMQRAVEGWTHEEIAAALGISAGDSRVIYHRARGKLRQWCGENPEDLP
jgi:RNA polymerase sigma-70 factor (ECF subfamily)